MYAPPHIAQVVVAQPQAHHDGAQHGLLPPEHRVQHALDASEGYLSNRARSLGAQSARAWRGGARCVAARAPPTRPAARLAHAGRIQTARNGRRGKRSRQQPTLISGDTDAGEGIV